MIAASVLKFTNNKKFLFSAVVIFFTPFLLFCFWNVPSADDYMILYKKQEFSFWGLQNSIYHTWSGRYFSTFVSTAFSYSGFLYSNYYLHTILLLLFTVLSWIFLLKQVNKNALSNQLSFTAILLTSLILLILEVNIIPEPVTAFYWFSSAITYQLPLILLVLLAGLICKLFFEPHHQKFYFFVAALIVVLFNGCNESITLFVLIISTFFIGYHYFTGKSVPGIFLSLYIINVISSCFLLFAPGIIHRGSLHDTSPVLSIISIAFIKFIVLNWFFLKEPLWWFLLLFVIAFLSRNNRSASGVLQLFHQVKSTSLLLVYWASGMLIYIPILYATNGSLPLRTENVICFLYSLMLLIIFTAFIINSTKTTHAPAFLYNYRYLLFSIFIFSSSNMKRVTDTLLSGFFYKQVMQERLSFFEDARRKQLHVVAFDEYELAVDKRIKEYPLLDRRALKNIMVKPPPIICFESDLYDIEYMKEFYGVKIININKR